MALVSDHEGTTGRAMVTCAASGVQGDGGLGWGVCGGGRVKCKALLDVVLKTQQ